MKNLTFGTSFAVFAIFFGAALLDAAQTQNWLRVAIFAALAALALWADTKEK
ncbi:MAG: hypothetical protein WCT41_02990 [Candidatus Paceibacterota bacterium]|jgi:hypothetical protein